MQLPVMMSRNTEGCRNCAGPLRPEASICDYCGSPLKAPFQAHHLRPGAFVSVSEVLKKAYPASPMFEQLKEDAPLRAIYAKLRKDIDRTIGTFEVEKGRLG